ncbi:hypothetical protein QTH91_02225 [Variovorax dokdonensis]|uniref:Lipoprotein n=1 Tax=Variovorax dokdonensis TaxID=344883 RepID=A0ABT7N5R3_9BURK|nr:hypothetical protein [Variovorax dokdonensis]MDM0043289.1 hypothetical protein [Variovorax dokdonensis]
MNRIAKACALAFAVALAGCAQDAAKRQAADSTASAKPAPAGPGASSAPVSSTPPASIGADQTFWKDAQGRPVPDADNRKSSNGFGAWLLFTPDADWKERWEKPANGVASLNEANEVSRGKKLFALILVGNPALNEQQADVGCALELTRPDGQVVLRQSDLACLRGPVSGGARSLYMSAPVIAFEARPDEPAGTWTMRALVRDKLRGAQVLLRNQFILKQ